MRASQYQVYNCFFIIDFFYYNDLTKLINKTA